MNAGDEVYSDFINRFKKLKDTKQQVADYLKKGWIWAIFFLYLVILFVFAFADLGDRVNYHLYTIGLKKDRFEYLPPNPMSPSVFERQGVWLAGYGPDYVGLLVYAAAGVFAVILVKRKIPL